MVRFSRPPDWPLPVMITVEEVEPEETAPFQEVMRQFRRNCNWLDCHWREIMPKADGKFLAVAGQEWFLGETQEEAWGKAVTAHPDDAGAFIQFVQAASQAHTVQE